MEKPKLYCWLHTDIELRVDSVYIKEDGSISWYVEPCEECLDAEERAGYLNAWMQRNEPDI